MSKSQRFSLISKASGCHPQLSIELLCKEARVSRSGYYYWLNRRRLGQELSFEEELIIALFDKKKGKAGARTIKMELAHIFFQTVNLKKVRRIMKKHQLRASIRRRRIDKMFYYGPQHKVFSNIVNQNFKVQVPDKVYATDITYLQYGNSCRAYMSAMKDLGTKEIIHFKVFGCPNMELVMGGINECLSAIPFKKRKKLLIHSDQGGHYTSKRYQDILKSKGVSQSMSRRGNCLDNAPIESFFGHMKDEVELNKCNTLGEVQRTIEEYVHYYNNDRPQWGLNGKTPKKYRTSLNVF